MIELSQITRENHFQLHRSNKENKRLILVHRINELTSPFVDGIEASNNYTKFMHHYFGCGVWGYNSRFEKKKKYTKQLPQSN